MIYEVLRATGHERERRWRGPKDRSCFIIKYRDGEKRPKEFSAYTSLFRGSPADMMAWLYDRQDAWGLKLEKPKPKEPAPVPAPEPIPSPKLPEPTVVAASVRIVEDDPEKGTMRFTPSPELPLAEDPIPIHVERPEPSDRWKWLAIGAAVAAAAGTAYYLLT